MTRTKPGSSQTPRVRRPSAQKMPGRRRSRSAGGAVASKSGRAALLVALCLTFTLLRVALPQQRPNPAVPKNPATLTAEQPPVATHHVLRLPGRTLNYTATAGTLPLKNTAGELQANIFYIFYTAENAGAPASRPLIFIFNGGPGAASVWLHLGAVGPRRVQMLDQALMPPPPFTLVDNQYTWLDIADLVFIDPVGTGYSRATQPKYGKQYWGITGDIESVGEFIRLFLGRNQRWTSPMFVAGESYGTTRAAGLSSYLLEHGIALNGVILLSSVLNFETLEFAKGNDLPYVLYLPSYTAVAWYHKKLPSDLQQRDLGTVLREVENWAMNTYAPALAKGDQITGPDRQAIAQQLSRFTGISARFIDESDLRLDLSRFRKELLRDQRRTVGRLDGRFKGIDLSVTSSIPEYDPAIAAIIPPFTSAFNEYVRTELGYKYDLEYYVLGGGIGPWEWGSAEKGFPDTSEALRRALTRNAYMKLFVGSGYYDLATPFFATQYTLRHLDLDPSLKSHISNAEFDAGHMMYIHSQSLAKLKQQVATFVHTAAAAH